MVTAEVGLTYSLAKCPQCKRKYAIIPMGMSRFVLWESKELADNETTAPAWAVQVEPQSMIVGMLTLQALTQIASPACPECDSGDVKATVAEMLSWPNVQWDTLVFLDRETTSLEMLIAHAAPVDGGWLHLPLPMGHSG